VFVDLVYLLAVYRGREPALFGLYGGKDDAVGALDAHYGASPLHKLQSVLDLVDAVPRGRIW